MEEYIKTKAELLNRIGLDAYIKAANAVNTSLSIYKEYEPEFMLASRQFVEGYGFTESRPITTISKKGLWEFIHFVDCLIRKTQKNIDTKIECFTICHSYIENIKGFIYFKDVSENWLDAH